jgi:uncharacterized membrane protein required for colicin V production
MYLWLIMILLFFGCVAFLVNGGLWTNTLVLINTVTAGLIAFNYFEPLAGWLDKQLPSFTYVWDFLCVWLVFAVAMGIMRTATDLLSRVKVKFKRPVDQVGGILMACIVGIVMVCFTMATLHTAPLARKFLFDNFDPDSPMSMSPDRKWLNFVGMESKRSFYHGGPKENRHAFYFTPTNVFISKYADRRADFEKQIETRVNTGP